MLWFLVIGLIAGVLARLLVPGPDPMGVLATTVLGIVGSFVGGFLAALLPLGPDPQHMRPAGIFGSVIGAVVALLIYRRVQARSV
ncbi:MAG: GlsB/YeaQ/YmgE family stress response membrane protein [Egibacteraceae bacterium]